MKIIFLQNIDGIAGSEKYFLALIPELIKKGVAIELCCVIKDSAREKASPYLELLKKKDIPYSVVNCRSYASPFILKKINKRIRTFSADILHCHLIYADAWGAAIKQFLNKNIRIISTKHGYHEDSYVKYCLKPEELPKNLYYYLFKYSHKRMDASYACSYGLVNFYTKANLITKGEMQVIQHGFDYPENKVKDEKHRFSKNQIIITGRLIKRKGHHFIIDIMPELIEKHPDICLIILGKGVLESELKQKVKSLDVSNHVKFMGFQSNVPSFLKSSNIMLVTSYSEGLPLVIFEAFNTKTPVITFDTIGSNELVTNNETGVIVPAFDTNSLSYSISELLTDKVKAKQLADEAFSTLKTKFSLERMTNETINFYAKNLSF